MVSTIVLMRKWVLGAGAMLAAVVLFGAAFGGCIAVPVGGGYAEPAVVVGPPAVVIDPFPHVWIGPGYYGGRYYGSHPGHGGYRGGGHRR